MKRSGWLAVLLVVLGVTAVVRAQSGVITTGYSDPRIQIEYEQLPLGWTLPGESPLFWSDKSPFADGGATLTSDYNFIRTSDDYGRTIEMQYAYRHRGTIELRAQFPEEVTSIETLRAYVQREHESNYADFQGEEIVLDGQAGYLLSLFQSMPTRVESDCPYDPSECSLYSADAWIYRYYLINVAGTTPLLIEVELNADAYHEAYSVDDAVRGTAADWVSRIGGEWDRQVQADIQALDGEASQIVNTLRFGLEGQGLPAGGPTPGDSSGQIGVWRFSYKQVIDPSTPGYMPQPDKIEDNCKWGFAVEVAENSAVSTFQYNTAQDAGCYFSDGGPGNAASAHAWTVPPNILIPGDIYPFELAITEATYKGAAPYNRMSAWTSLWMELSSQECVFDDCLLGESYFYQLDETYGILPATSQGRWPIPGGRLGDQLTLSVNILGVGHHALVNYVYEFQNVTPGSDDNGSTAADPGPDDPFTPDDSLTIEEISLMLPAGFGDLGAIPGPEALAQALAGVVAPAVLIAILSSLGNWGGSDAPPDGDGGPPPSAGPAEMTMTDTLGRSFTYVWSPEYGGYISPETGGMFDPSLWAEYNQNLPGNQAFIAQQRENMAEVTPPSPQQEFKSALAMAQKMLARIPYRHGDPLQKRLDAIHNSVRTQGIGSEDIASVRKIAHSAWGHYQERQVSIRQEQMDMERRLGYIQTGLQVAATMGKISGSIAEGALGGSGFITGFIYGAAENWDKGATGMVANGLIGGGFGWAGNRLGNVSPDGITWNAFTGGLSGAAESAASDWFNTGQVDVDKMKMSAGIGAAGGAFGAGMQKWLGGANAPPKTADLPPGTAPDMPPGKPGGGDAPEARLPFAPDAIPPSQTIPLSQQPPGVRKMFSNVEFGPDGKPYARLEDVITLQSSSTDMRALKNASPEVREAFNNTLRKEVYDPHDRELLDWISKNVPDANGRPVTVDDFRTPGAGGPDPRAINTDRDYRVLMQNEKGEWIEVRKELWQDKSYELFGKQTGFDGTAVQRAHPEIDWDRMTPEQRLARQQELWADSHQQLATDRASIEASPDYSDQGVEMGQWAQVESNIVKVKHGQATLQDADAIGQMYYEKVAASLRRGNPPEAVAQAQKAVKSLWDVRKGYALQKLPVGNLPDNLNQAMHVIKNAPVDHRATAEAMTAMNRQLANLGFPGGVDQVSRAMSAQFSALRMAGGK